jgi:anti-anti-sigma factor
MTAAPPRDQLLVAIHDGTAYVHVRGRGSFKVGTALKRFGQGAMEASCRDLVLDLSECLGMDSTFMGVLAGLAFRFKEQGLGDVCLVNLNEANHEVLTTIGLDRVFRTYLETGTPEAYRAVFDNWAGQEAMPQTPETRRQTTETMLEAHEDLVKAAPNSLPEFKDVITYLRDDLEKADLDRDTPE